MRYFAALLFLQMLLFGCNSSKDENSDFHIPKLTIIDSVQVDRLTIPSLLDYTENHFLFFDYKSNELVITDRSGNILKEVNRAEDGPNSYQSDYFYAARFLDNQQIIIETYSGRFLYDLDFNLVEKRNSDFSLYTNSLGDTPSFLVDGKYQFKFGYFKDDSPLIRTDQGITMEDYHFLKTLDPKGQELHSAPIPRSVNYLVSPGKYISYDANGFIKGDRIYLQFMLTPYLYEFSFPELELLDSVSLSPGADFKSIKPSPGDNFGSFFEELRGSRYENFAFSNGYLLTWYLKGAPDEEVDALDRRVVGDENYLSVERKFKTPVYQIFKGKEKIWEGEWPVKLEAKKSLLYSVNSKPQEIVEESERDVQTYYFYELR